MSDKAARSYSTLGAVKPHVRNCAIVVGNQHDVETIYGIGTRTGPSDHPLGLALDFMVYKDRAKGDAVVATLRSNWKTYGIKYIIWQQAIDEGSGFKPMENRGSDTANHRDHPHVSFHPTPGDASAHSGGVDKGTATAINGSYPWDFLTSGDTWLGILMFIIGMGLVGYFLWRALTNG